MGPLFVLQSNSIQTKYLNPLVLVLVKYVLKTGSFGSLFGVNLELTAFLSFLIARLRGVTSPGPMPSTQKPYKVHILLSPSPHLTPQKVYRQLAL